MPRGKLATTGSVSWAVEFRPRHFMVACTRLPEDNNWELPTCQEMREICLKVRSLAIQYYTRSQTPVPTVTFAKRHLSKICTSAKKLYGHLLSNACSTKKQRELKKLLRLLDTDMHIRQLIYTHIYDDDTGYSAIEFKGALTRLGKRNISQIEVRKLMGALDRMQSLKSLRIDLGRSLRDPYLEDLVRQLVPVWGELTRRSPRTYYAAKGEHPFAIWVNDVLEPIRYIQRQGRKDVIPQVTRGMVEALLPKIENAK